MIFLLFFVILITILLLIIIFKPCKKFEKFDSVDKIDIVITWVELNDDFEKEKRYWLQKESNSKLLKDDFRRYNDNEELKYCLRSIEKHFPYFNNIYLVVKDGQFPFYLKHEHPKLKVIKHSDIIPEEYLPTFNSLAIECYLHHIPNLSENYLYLNDDFMFLKNTQPSYFIENDKPVYLYTGKPYEYYRLQGAIDLNSYEFIDGIRYNNYILNSIGFKEPRYQPVSHTPQMYNKKFDYEIEKFFKNYYIEGYDIDLYDLTGMSKFRKNNNLFLVSIMKGYLYKYWFDIQFKETSSLVLTLDNNNSQLDKTLDLKNQFLCMESVGHNNIEKYYNFMEDLYPEKSSFEN
jgi:hypothetical protein